VAGPIGVNGSKEAGLGTLVFIGTTNSTGLTGG
jgi:hypothetical protein